MDSTVVSPSSTLIESANVAPQHGPPLPSHLHSQLESIGIHESDLAPILASCDGHVRTDDGKYVGTSLSEATLVEDATAGSAGLKETMLKLHNNAELAGQALDAIQSVRCYLFCVYESAN
jgi:hypothetical protein